MKAAPRALIGFTALFLGGFAIAERDGLIRLIGWVGRAIVGTPDAIGAIVAYFSKLPSDTFARSLTIGVVVGLTFSAYLALRLRRRGLFIAPPIAIGLIGGAIGSQIVPYALRHCTYAADAPPAEAIIGVILTGISALIVVVPAWAVRIGRRAAWRTVGTFQSAWLPVALLAPTLLGLLLFLYYPGLQTALISLNARRAGLPQERFVCLRNYTAIASDIIYRNSVITSAFLTIILVTVSMACALGIALLASQKVRGIGIYRSLIIFPFALSPVVSGTIFLAMFRQGSSGLINYLFNLDAHWLNQPTLARIVVIITAAWNILGFNTLFYIVGLQNVPSSLVEAAAIDGANRPTRFFRVTLPLLAPYTFFLLVTNVTYAFYGIYGVVDTLTQGGPPLGPAGSLGGATNVLIYKMYSDAFTPGSPFGSAAAQAVMLFLLVAGLTVLQFRTLEQRIVYND